jgi:hypothetical protein
MALAKRQKALIGVFCLGVLGLVVDRVFLRPQGGPGTASADTSETYTVPVSSADSASSASAEAQSQSIAERLDRLWPDWEPNAAEARDPFSLADSWLHSMEAGPSTAPNPAAEFAKAHPLVAVVLDGRQSHVLINDRFLTLGEQIDGFTLVSVGPKSAVLERQGEQIVLELASK